MIHPTAIIDPSAELATDVSVGPYSIIEAGVKIGPGCQIAGHVQLLNQVTIGENCQIHGAAIIGGNPQDLSFNPETKSGVSIGPNNVIREHVTIHRGSVNQGETRLGQNNYLMAGSHVAHDTVLGDHNILANSVMLGGWVVVGNRNFIGGGAGIHQFVRIGDYCMIKGLSAISQDLPPYTLSAGSNSIRGLNTIGLQRSGMDRETRNNIKDAFTMFYRSGKNFSQALADIDNHDWTPEARVFFDFVKATSKKGICSYH